jgi:hypothetical protein
LGAVDIHKYQNALRLEKRAVKRFFLNSCNKKGDRCILFLVKDLFPYLVIIIF